MATNPAFEVFNGLAPRGVPKAMPIRLDFTSVSPQYIDLLIEEQFSTIEFVQGIYVDNSDNPTALTLIFEITQQRIVVPANAQGVWPVLAPEKTKFSIATTLSDGLIVRLLLLNVPMPFTQWGPFSITAALNPVVGAFSNISGAVALGGTSQQLSAVNAARKRIIIENPSTIAGQNIAAVESLFVNFAGAAGVDDGVSLEIFPGGSWDSNFGPVPSNAFNVTAATTGHRFIAKEL